MRMTLKPGNDGSGFGFPDFQVDTTGVSLQLGSDVSTEYRIYVPYGVTPVSHRYHAPLPKPDRNNPFKNE